MNTTVSRINIFFLSVALNYGVFRRKEFNSTAVHYMFYDVGSTKTTASVVGMYYSALLLFLIVSLPG